MTALINSFGWVLGALLGFVAFGLVMVAGVFAIAWLIDLYRAITDKPKKK